MCSPTRTWYEAHIVCPDYEIYGYYIAGTPFPLLGHNHDYAYGLTMFENDDVDFFAEEENPNNVKQYKTPEGYKNYTYQQKIIKVKDSAQALSLKSVPNDLGDLPENSVTILMILIDLLEQLFVQLVVMESLYLHTQWAQELD